MQCRFCHTPLEHVFVDLGHSSPSNSFLTEKQLQEPEVFYPLKLYVCHKCWLVQLAEYKKAREIFSEEYVYYSSESPSNVSHAKEYVDMVIDWFKLGKGSTVYEIGSNDGYLLQHFPKEIKTVGIDPAWGPAKKAAAKGITTMVEFFTTETASRIMPADLICGINVLAHQPDINNFVKALKIALAPNGVITQEFPHLMRLVEDCQFDTIYHEHYSYFSLETIRSIFLEHGLDVFDVEELPTHGGSLRIYAKHTPFISRSDKVGNLLSMEHERGMNRLDYYLGFQANIDTIKTQLVHFLIDAKMEGATVVGYGAAAKGVAFLNYCGIRSDLIPHVIDRSPHKHGKYLPGSHIPVVSEGILKEDKPAYVLILAWNLRDEIMEQLKYIRGWNGKFVVAIPELEIL